MDFGQNMSFFEQRAEILLTDIRDAINQNAEETKKVAEETKRVAEALEIIASCVDTRVRAFPHFNTNDINYRP